MLKLGKYHISSILKIVIIVKTLLTCLSFKGKTLHNKYTFQFLDCTFEQFDTSSFTDFEPKTL